MDGLDDDAAAGGAAGKSRSSPKQSFRLQSVSQSTFVPVCIVDVDMTWHTWWVLFPRMLKFVFHTLLDAHSAICRVNPPAFPTLRWTS